MEETGQGLSAERDVSRHLKEAKEASSLKIAECSEQKGKELQTSAESFGRKHGRGRPGKGSAVAVGQCTEHAGLASGGSRDSGEGLDRTRTWKVELTGLLMECRKWF